MSIRFTSESSEANGIISINNITKWYNNIFDEFANEIGTMIQPYKVEVSTRIKQLKGSKVYVYIDNNDIPIAMEHEDHGEIGGLWFKGKTLVDYDGCYSLPSDIIKTIRALGYHVPKCMCG